MMAKAWAKAAVAGAALMMGAPVWGSGPREGVEEIGRSGHWTFEIFSGSESCNITGYANPNDIYSDNISMTGVYDEHAGIFSAYLDLSEKSFAELEKNGDTQFGFAFLPTKGDDKSSIGWFIGTRPDKFNRRISLHSGPLQPFRDIAAAKNTNIVRVFGGRKGFLDIPLPDDFFELAENCMDESAKRKAERYGKAK